MLHLVQLADGGAHPELPRRGNCAVTHVTLRDMSGASHWRLPPDHLRTVSNTSRPYAWLRLFSAPLKACRRGGIGRLRVIVVSSHITAKLGTDSRDWRGHNCWADHDAVLAAMCAAGLIEGLPNTISELFCFGRLALTSPV
jgi:hypothetical protein